MISTAAEGRQAGARLASAGPTATPGRCALTSSTPDALWSSRSVRLLRPAAVEARGLHVHRRDRQNGLRGLDLSVPVGARLLLVSRPEAAASLLLRTLAGLVRPAAGTVALAGVQRSDDSASGWARRVGYVPPDPAIYPWLAPAEALMLAARLAGIDRGEARRRVDEAIGHFRLGRDAAGPMHRGGPIVIQKTALAAAMLTQPEVLLLDEPLRSLDPDERQRLLRIRGRRLTVILASRYPASEEGLVTQLALIRDGRLRLHASVGDLVAASLPLSLRGIEALADLPPDARPVADHSPPPAAAVPR